MGEVYRARDTRLERHVAIKVLPEALTRDPDALRRFELEAKAVAALSHPNILAIHDFGEERGVSYAVMELLEGTTLRDRLGAGGLSIGQAVDFAVQTAKGLSAAHQKGIVHRDLKPENLFVTRDGVVKILDFGLAKRLVPSPADGATNATTEAQHTAPGTIMGTIGYMSPEQVRGLPIDHRSDIFSFGAILYEMLSGRRAFRGETPADTLVAILTREPPALAVSEGGIPALESAVRRCLEKEPQDRFADARDLLVALSGGFASVPRQPDARAAEPVKPRNVRRFAAIAAAVLLGGVATVLFLHRRGVPAEASPSIAVLPFENLSGDKDQEYFSDGLSEELMDLLTKIPALRVAGRTSAFAFKGKTGDLAEIGRKLHVATVLEGSVRRSGDRIRISTQLVNVADGYQRWAETYDRKLTDVFAVQDEIAGSVVAALKVKLLPNDRRISAPTTSPEAHTQYLLARRFAARANAEGDRLAIAAYRRAIELDPNYAAAYAGLAGASYWVADTAGGAPEVIAREREEARAAAEKSIALDPNLASGYGARGLLRYGVDWDWSGAQQDFERAIALDPGDMVLQIVDSYVLATLGRVPEAAERARKAIVLDPLSPRGGSNLGYYLNTLGRLPEARRALEGALEVNPEDEYVRFNLGTNLLLSRRPGEALAEYRRAGDARGLAGVAMAEHDLGDAAASGKALEELMARHGADSPYRVAQVHAWRGERDAAFDWLETAYRRRDQNLADIKFDPLLAGIRGDPRYAALLRKMNLPTG